jgi:hypothetical protein
MAPVTPIRRNSLRSLAPYEPVLRVLVDLDVHRAYRAVGDDHFGAEIIGVLDDFLDLCLALLRLGDGECAAAAGNLPVVLLDGFAADRLDQLVEVRDLEPIYCPSQGLNHRL